MYPQRLPCARDYGLLRARVRCSHRLTYRGDFDIVAKMNISELARRLNVSIPELRTKFVELGIDIGARAIKIDDRLAQEVMEKAGSELLSRRRAPAAPAAQPQVKEQEAPKELLLPAHTTVRELASILNVPVADVITVLLKNGFVATINEEIDFETASIAALEFGREAKRKGREEIATDEGPGVRTESSKSEGEPRAPVVVVMGHIDHGKTTLLDALRSTKVAKTEAGGITQHIGAYQAVHRGKPITVIDTPGHEAFLSLRSRGAQVADLAILVVAADDGVKPQTVESLRIIDRVHVPMLVAINKIDREGADAERAKRQLADAGVIPKEWGGTVRMVPISAKERTGLDTLLDAVWEVLEGAGGVPHARAEGPARGVVIEAHLDRGEGPVAAMLIQEGTLSVRDTIVAGGAVGKIRGMRDANGKTLTMAGPATPVQIFGLQGLPAVGTPFVSGEEVAHIRQGTITRRIGRGIASRPPEEGKVRLVLFVKSDRIGSLEAMTEGLARMEEEGVSLTIAEEGLGDITESDVVLAKKIGAAIYGFGVGVLPSAREFAREEQVPISTSPIIYELFDRVRQDVDAVRPRTTRRETLGRIRILKLFRRSGNEEIAGGRVEEGIISGGGVKMDVVRERRGRVSSGELLELHIGPSVAKEVRAGAECGVRVACRTPLAVGDELRMYREVLEEYAPSHRTG